MSDSTKVAAERLLPWQQTAWQHLNLLRTQQRLPHGLLLRGPEGTGKRRFALQFAQQLLCQSVQDSLPCGHCKSCQLIQAGSHPDLTLLEPIEEARQIKIEQVRELMELMGKSAQYGGYRVVVIAPAEAMNTNAANALLKMLEEPGVDTILLLVTHQASGLLATIRSRCQAVQFPLPPADQALDWLSGKIGNTDEAGRLLAVAGGAPCKALSLRGADWLTERERVCREWVAMLSGDASPVHVAQGWSKLPLVDVVRALLAWQVDLGRILAGAPERVLNRDLVPLLERAANCLGSSGMERFYIRLQQALGWCTSTANPNAQLLLESLLLDCRQYTA